MRRDAGPDFVEALARGLDVLRCFRPGRPEMTLSDVATATGLARPTARRMLLTLQELGYVDATDRGFTLTPRVLDLGMAYIGSQGLWEIARPHMERLVHETGESSSMAQLDGSDIVYVARVAVPKIIALAVTIGTRFPAAATSQGRVLLAALEVDRLAAVLAQAGRSGVTPRRTYGARDLEPVLREVRARGWALADEDLAVGIRSVAVPVRDGDGQVIAAMNVTVHAAETSVETLLERHLPRLLRTASAVSADWAAWRSMPVATVEPRPGAGGTGGGA
ncbi:IclR family transcriptional regulator C-terminal domain-containing protein [Streptomyces sp. TS71-3]|uniref:IclR family transcriptional regulator domain-containing protein n=1 Tax=Streptomyces sp. TS71-3 TaxID=2733862 RepID=UPI001B0B8EB6|nr:IclR family transcriptional regulator C-terminal domain-containing protein [Streptomyces sp. TS71-3]GHJ35705.1 IclR family transcriptional regulator [Streptomyces sp. TS71-3]